MKKIISWIGTALWLLFLCLSAYNFYIYPDLRRSIKAHAVLPGGIFLIPRQNPCPFYHIYQKKPSSSRTFSTD